MHTLLLVLVTSGLMLLQTIPGLTANLEPDADFLEEAVADGFIVATKGPTKTEKPQDNYNAVITHDSQNPEANQSLFQKGSLPTGTLAKTPEDSTELTPESANEIPKNESAIEMSTVGSSQSTTLSPEEIAEGSGIFPERVIELGTSVIHTGMETAAEVDVDGSGMFSETLNEKQGKVHPVTTTVRNSGDLDISTVHSSEENTESGMRTEAPTSNWLITTSTFIVEETEIAVHRNNEVAKEKPFEESSPDPVEKEFFQPKTRRNRPDTNINAQTEEGTPGWLLILALCLTVGAIICILVGVATKDRWYGPTRKCLNINSTESQKHKEYNKAATLPLSEKEKMALLSAQREERKETDCTIISLEVAPEKEYLM